MKMSPFSAPFSWGTKSEGFCFQGELGALSEGTQWCKGGTGKAAKLLGVGIGPSSALESERQKKVPVELNTNQQKG
jgi:hypothetical protein